MCIYLIFLQCTYLSFLLDFRGCRSAIGQFGIEWASTGFGQTNTQLCPTGEGKKLGRGTSHIVLVSTDLDNRSVSLVEHVGGGKVTWYQLLCKLAHSVMESFTSVTLTSLSQSIDTIYVTYLLSSVDLRLICRHKFRKNR